jgi:hypothetical protein
MTASIFSSPSSHCPMEALRRGGPRQENRDRIAGDPVSTSERTTGLEAAIHVLTLRVRDGGPDLLRRAA